jgi:hypothetical protein
MQEGVRFWVKHSGEFLYKMSNEEDRMNFKVWLYCLLSVDAYR